MRRRSLSWLLLTGVLLLAGCADHDGITPPPAPTGAPAPFDPRAIVPELLAAAGWECDPPEDGAAKVATPGAQAGATCLEWYARTMLDSEICHYEWHLRLGPGPHDVVGLHRVVKESAPFRPLRTRRAVFLQHGGGKNFVGNFMPWYVSAVLADDFGLAVFLARQDVDVWGLDARSTLVEWQGPEVPFMAEWGMEGHLADLTQGLELARLLRLATGSGPGGFILGAYSSGAVLGYALVGAEAGLPAGLRRVCGFVPMEYGMKSSNPVVEQRACAALAENEGLMAAGVFGAQNLLPLVGMLAREDPAGPSPLAPGLTNLQAALSLQSWPLNDPLTGHFAAGVFDEFGIATGLQYQSIESNLDFLCSGPAYDQPVAFSRDVAALGCPGQDVPWDDALAQIRIPILLVAAAGGYGVDYDDLDRVGSADKTRLLIALHPPEEVLLDYGHIDPFNASNAPELVWQPILDWIVAHSPARALPAAGRAD